MLSLQLAALPKLQATRLQPAPASVRRLSKGRVRLAKTDHAAAAAIGVIEMIAVTGRLAKTGTRKAAGIAPKVVRIGPIGPRADPTVRKGAMIELARIVRHVNHASLAKQDHHVLRMQQQIRTSAAIRIKTARFRQPARIVARAVTAAIDKVGIGRRETRTVRHGTTQPAIPTAS